MPYLSDEPGSLKESVILVVEDNEADVFLIRDAIRSADLKAQVHVVSDGELATRYLEEIDRDAAKPCPVAVVLDINLPRKKGTLVVGEIRRSRRCGNAAIVAVSSSRSSKDEQTMLNLGANAYFPKPSTYAAFMKLGELLRDLTQTAQPPEPSKK